ncbi:hypothetical protein GR702_11650 [Novosphingobium sp. FGD1]|uniref:Uncharacterized protein n=1 Tax=Novosphingobium silvae TaxID=2692619 RepID=A0A7X4GH18_9SPHN|nr:hypothetical protein [Novosphingobium silvae]MYL98418.1 hypothetical protein [Novosphingobium silvae]
MNLTLNARDISKLSHSARAELQALLFPKAGLVLPEGFTEDDFKNVVDLTLEQITEFMENCSQSTKDGLEVMAIHGPVVDARLLYEVEIENLGSWQGGITKRTRTVTGDRKAYMLAWDDWSSAPDNIGRYAVTPITHQSLQAYFGEE